MFRVLDIYIIQDFSLWFYYFLGVAFNFTMNPGNLVGLKITFFIDAHVHHEYNMRMIQVLGKIKRKGRCFIAQDR